MACTHPLKDPSFRHYQPVGNPVIYFKATSIGPTAGYPLGYSLRFSTQRPFV